MLPPIKHVTFMGENSYEAVRVNVGAQKRWPIWR
jgi:hypothetical protein